ncbi:MFS transporter [Stappia sp. F7233]|uniref:MFS transporter n=1 Tax=Stappia albiluteola TaxID=2758565 RepID=A0A839AKA4_9HYPH|nr:MFS transporter [Stappia albiluteola]MBA5779458.1 MFS transporter [Stappia albiluteola]
MTRLAKLSLMLVVFVDLLGQGLVFPIINSLVMEPTSGFLPADTSDTSRHLSYGIVIGIFFLAWFLGGPYISRLSDMIGRKNAILICLFGALAGYAITIASLYADSLALLVVGRAITGFTAGNQPIAQAAMIDGSVDETDRARNMGYIITGISFGLVGGPIIGGFLSDPEVMGRFASLQLPFYASFVLVALVIVLIVVFFEDARQEREPLVLRPLEVFGILWRVREYPVVMRLTAVLFFFHVANVTFYIFVDNYLTSRFGYGEFGGSMAMLTIGVALALSSTFFVVPAQKHFDKQTIIIANLLIWAACAAAFILSPAAAFCFVPIFIFYFVFGISYSTFLAVFAASVSDEEQGWVMGITVAVFTFIAGVMSLIGGDLMSIDIRMPFYIVIAAALAGCAAIPAIWGNTQIRLLLQRADS